MFSLMYLMYSHVKDYELGFSCVGTCVLVNLSGFDSSRSFVVTRSLRYPETTLQAEPACEGCEISCRIDCCLLAAAPLLIGLSFLKKNFKANKRLSCLWCSEMPLKGNEDSWNRGELTLSSLSTI